VIDYRSKTTEELQSMLETEENIGVRIDITLAIAMNNISSTPKESMELARQGLKLAEEAGDRNRIANALIYMGIIHARQGVYVSAISCFNRARTIKEEIGDKQAVAMCYNNLALVYKRQDDYTRAMELLQKSMHIKEEIGDQKGIAFCLNNLQSIYEAIGDFDKALEYLQRSLEIIKEQGSESEYSRRIHNMGNIYYRKGDFDRAMEFYENSSALNEKYNNLTSLAADYGGIAEIYRKKGEFERAGEYYYKALDIYEKQGNKSGITDTLINIGLMFTEMFETTKAIETSLRALNLALEIGSPKKETRICENLARTYELLGDYSNAFLYHKRFKELSDKIMGAEQVRMISQVEARAEIEKREKEAEIWKQASVTDTLTCLPNRRGILADISKQESLFYETGKPFTLIISDIDHFKQFNDKYGHECGDLVLIQVANVIKSIVEAKGLASRWGGEEFLMMLPGTDAETAMQTAEALRCAIEGKSVEYDGQQLSVTMSFGLCEFEADIDLDECIRRADEALYRAKESGRNQLCLFNRAQRASHDSLQ